MAYLGKEYKFEKHEKFDEFLVSLGVPKEQVETFRGQIISEKLEKDGDTYVNTFALKDVAGGRTLKFKSGEEFAEKLSTIEAKTTIVVDGNTVVQTQKLPDGRTITFKKVFTDNKMVTTATNSNWDGEAYRYYSA